MRIETWFFESLLLLFFLLILREVYIIVGKENTRIFLWGSILWTGVLENLFVMLGYYDYFAYANYYSLKGKLIVGYPGWFLLFLVVPLCIPLTWFWISLPALIVSIRLLGEKISVWVKAGFAAIMLVSLDMLLDPTAVVNEWWRWTMPDYYLRGVPLGNYMAWFFILFLYGAVYERTVLQKKGFRGLSMIERLIFKIDTLDLSTTPIRTIAKIFYFRVIACFPVFYFSLTIINGFVTNNFGNNLGPFDSVFPG